MELLLLLIFRDSYIGKQSVSKGGEKMSVNRYNSNTGELELLAGASRIWTGTQAALNAALDNNEIAPNTVICITDDGGISGNSNRLKVAKYFFGETYTTFSLSLDNPTENSGMWLVLADGSTLYGTINFLHEGTFTDGSRNATCSYNPTTGIATFSGVAAINTTALWYC